MGVCGFLHNHYPRAEALRRRAHGGSGSSSLLQRQTVVLGHTTASRCSRDGDTNFALSFEEKYLVVCLEVLVVYYEVLARFMSKV